MTIDKRTMIIAIVAGILLTLLIGAGVGYLVGSNVDRTAESDAADEPTTPGEGSQSAVDDEATDPEEGPAEQPSETLPAQAETPAQPTAPAGPTERQPGEIVSVANVNGTWMLQIDYVQFLSGDAANAAAAARGDETPVPNDYYIINDNPLVREFPIQAGIGVFVVARDDGTNDSSGHVLSLSEWVNAVNGPLGDLYTQNVYWVTVTNGTITAIEAQYVP